MPITHEEHDLLKDIVNNTERPDKLTIALDHETRTMVVTYDNMDDEWFKEMAALAARA